jgi:hypothetical protein
VFYDAFRRRFGRWRLIPANDPQEDESEYAPPSPAALARLDVGDVVDLTFTGWPGGRIYDCEHLQVEITAREGNRFRGRLLSDPSDLPQLRCARVIEFGPRHIIGIGRHD